MLQIVRNEKTIYMKVPKKEKEILNKELYLTLFSDYIPEQLHVNLISVN